MNLSKRERQILEILYKRGKATTGEVHEELADSSYSAVRGMLRVLHEKGLVNYDVDGVKYVFSPVIPRDEAAKSALTGLLDTFFQGSVEQAVSTLIGQQDRQISDKELDRLAALIEDARKKRS